MPPDPPTKVAPFIKPPMLKTWIHPTMLDFKKGYNLCNIRNITFSKPSRPPPRGWVGVGTPDFKWLGWLNGGKTQNPKKSLYQNLTPQKYHAAFPSHKIFEKALNDITRKNRNISFEYPEKFLLKSSYAKKYLPKFFFPEKFFDHPCHQKSRLPPPPPPLSHIHFSWQCMEIVRRKLMLVTIRVNLLLGEG